MSYHCSVSHAPCSHLAIRPLNLTWQMTFSIFKFLSSALSLLNLHWCPERGLIKGFLWYHQGVATKLSCAYLLCQGQYIVPVYLLCQGQPNLTMFIKWCMMRCVYLSFPCFNMCCHGISRTKIYFVAFMRRHCKRSMWWDAKCWQDAWNYLTNTSYYNVVITGDRDYL